MSEACIRTTVVLFELAHRDMTTLEVSASRQRRYDDIDSELSSRRSGGQRLARQDTGYVSSDLQRLASSAAAASSLPYSTYARMYHSTFSVVTPSAVSRESLPPTNSKQTPGRGHGTGD